MVASPTAKRRRVGMELKRLREAAGMTATDAAKALEVNQSTISRIEAGKFALRPVMVRGLLDLYGVTDEGLRETLLSLARTSGERGWWHKYGSAVPEWFETYVGLEAGANSVRFFNTHVVPGLLQTRGYAATVVKLYNPARSEEEVEQLVEARIARQRRLSEDPLQVRAILGEAALHCRVGSPEVTRGQLKHLVEVGQRPNVLVQVLPFSSSAYVVYGRSFVLLDFEGPADPGLVYMDHDSGALYLDRAEEIARFRLVYEQLQAAAAGPEASRDMMEAAMEQHRT